MLKEVSWSWRGCKHVFFFFKHLHVYWLLHVLQHSSVNCYVIYWMDSMWLPAQVLPRPLVQVQLPQLHAKIMDSFPFWTFWQASEPCLCLFQGTDPNNKQRKRQRNSWLKFIWLLSHVNLWLYAHSISHANKDTPAQLHVLGAVYNRFYTGQRWSRFLTFCSIQ